MGSSREKSNIAIAILGNWTFLDIQALLVQYLDCLYRSLYYFSLLLSVKFSLFQLSQYDSCCSFSLLEAIAKRFFSFVPLKNETIAIALPTIALAIVVAFFHSQKR